MIEIPIAEQVSSRFNTLDEYETWVSENWIHELGSEEAQLHVRSKLREEVGELSFALEHESPDQIKSELGDVLWTASAVAINEGFSLESAFQHSSVADSFPNEPMTLEAVDRVAQEADIEWDVPVLRALYNLASEEIKEGIASDDLKTTQMVMESLAGQLGKSARMTRVLGSTAAYNERFTYATGWEKLHEARIAEALTQITLLISIIAQRHLDSTLAEVAQANYNKLSQRLAQGHPVTKSSQ